MKTRWIGLAICLGFACGASGYAVIKAAQAGAVARYQATLIAELADNIDGVKSQTTSALCRLQTLENSHGRDPAAKTRPAANSP